MKKQLSLWQLGSFIFTAVLGVLLHFLFDLSGQNAIVGSFSAVNESIWEHIKLVFFPMFIFSLVQSRYQGHKYPNFWCIKLVGTLLAMVLIPVLYYTINGIFGPTRDWMNIAIFFISVATSTFVETLLFKKSSIECAYPQKAILIFVLIAILFVVFTFIPPQIPLFEDPITKSYGYFENI